MLPMADDRVELDDYLKFSPRLPDEEKLRSLGFFTQHAALDVDTGNRINVIMTLQPVEHGRLPLIFDIEATSGGSAEPRDWALIRSKVDSLRNLKNRIFKNTLTEKCLNLYSR